MPVTATLRPGRAAWTGRLRWAGFAGAASLTLGGYLAGALPGAAPASRAEALWGHGPPFRVGLLVYLAGLVLLGWAWWRLGAALRAADPPPVRWVLVTGAVWAAPLLIAPPLGSRDLYAYACQGALWLDGHDPYAVGAAAGGCGWVEAVPDLWQQTTAPYGPLALVVSAAAVALARVVVAGETGQLLVAVAVLRVAAVAGAVLVAGFGPTLARAAGVAPAPAVWLGLVTPLVAVHVVAGGHNDALVAGLVVAALALATRRWPAAAAVAGFALGLAVAVKVTAVVALPFVLLLAWGPGRRHRAAALAAGAATAAFAALTLLTGLGTGWTVALADTGALVQWTSLPTGLGMAAGYGLWALGAPAAYDTAVAVARLIGLAVLTVVLGALLVRAWRRVEDVRTVVACGGMALAAVVVLGPVVYPWYAVVPLAVLAACVARPLAVRALAVATLVLTALVLPSGLGVPVLTKLPGALLVAASVVAVSGWWLRHRRRAADARAPGRPPAPSAPVR